MRGFEWATRRRVRLAAVVLALALPATAGAALVSHDNPAVVRLTPTGVAYGVYGTSPVNRHTLQGFISIRNAAPGQAPREIAHLPTVRLDKGIDVDASQFDFQISATRALYSVDRIVGVNEMASTSEGSEVADAAPGATPNSLESCPSLTLTDDLEPATPIALDGTVEAYIPVCTPNPPRVIVRDTATSNPATTIPIASSGATALQLAGQNLALIDPGRGQTVPDSASKVVVYSWATGATELSVPIPNASALALAPDGTLAVIVNDGATQNPIVSSCANGVELLSVTNPTPHKLPGCVAGTFVSLAGGRLTTLGANGRFAAMISEALDGSDPRTVVSLPTASVNADGIGGLAYDGSRVAYPLFRCDPRLGGVALDTLVNGASTTPAQTNCRLTLPHQRLRIRHGRVTVSFACPDGCGGSAEVASKGVDSPSGTFFVVRGRGHVTWRLSSFLRSAHTKRVALSVTIYEPSGDQTFTRTVRVPIG